MPVPPLEALAGWLQAGWSGSNLRDRRDVGIDVRPEERDNLQIRSSCVDDVVGLDSAFVNDKQLVAARLTARHFMTADRSLALPDEQAVDTELIYGVTRAR